MVRQQGVVHHKGVKLMKQRSTLLLMQHLDLQGIVRGLLERDCSQLDMTLINKHTHINIIQQAK